LQRTQEFTTEIRATTAEVNGINLQIASATKQQAVASGQINQSVQQVVEQNQDVLREAPKTRVMVTGIEQMTGLIVEQIAGYKTC
jgi:methyl-accepting chemotaxis protein